MRSESLRTARKLVIIIPLAVITLFPLYWMATMAFKPQSEWSPVTDIFWFPSDPTLDNFRQILGLDPIYEYLDATNAIKNSLIAAVGGTILAMTVGVGAAYGITRFRAGGRLVPFQILQLRMLPPVAVMIPILILWSYLHLIDTYVGLILMYGVVTFPFAVWLMRGFFLDVPREITQAAILDGCTHWGAFVKVVLPQVKGGLAVTALFVFILNWSDFLIALVLSRSEVITGPVFLSSLQFAGAGQLFGPQSALALILILPPAVFGLAIQRYLVRGLTFGAIKR